MREIGVAHQRTDAQRPVGESLDLIEPVEMRDVDQPVRSADAALHEVEQVGAGREIDGARLRGSSNGLGDRRRPDIVERFHAERL